MKNNGQSPTPDDGAALLDVIDRTPEWSPPVDPNLNRALSLADFLSVPRPKLHYHIKGILPEQGKMTISSVAKGYKTTLLQEIGLCAAMGNTEYLNFKFGDPARVLMAQPELSDSLMAERSTWITGTAPEWFVRNLALKNFFILETVHGRPSYWPEHPRCKQSKQELEQAIEQFCAQIVMVDSLYMSFAGMDENKGDQMAMALDYLATLTIKYGVAIILSHHFNKSGTAARGSSVYQGWAETDLEIVPIEQDPSVVRVNALMRCAFPKGFPAYWRKPNETIGWFELLPEDWQPEKKGGRPQSASPDIVRLVLMDSGTLKWKPLQQRVMEAAGVKERKAADLISEAKKAGLILTGAGYYTATPSINSTSGAHAVQSALSGENGNGA